MTTNINKEYYGRDWKFVAGKIGPILTLIMGILFFIEGITRTSFWVLFYPDTPLFYPDTPLLLMCGILAIAGVLLGLKGYKIIEVPMNAEPREFGTSYVKVLQVFLSIISIIIYYSFRKYDIDISNNSFTRFLNKVYSKIRHLKIFR